MYRNNLRGFSLIEVLVALVVLTIGVTAALSLSSKNIDNVSALEQRTVGHWVAQNLLVQTTIQPDTTETDTQGMTQMAGRVWYWQRAVEPTLDDSILRVTVSVFADEAYEDSLSQLVGYLPRVPNS